MDDAWIDEECVDEYADLEALLHQIERVQPEPPALRERLVELVEETAKLRFYLESVADQVSRLPDVRGKLSILDDIDRALHGRPRRPPPPEPVTSTVANWEANIRFELARWDQLPLEEASDALERIEDFAAKQVDATIDRVGALFE